MLTHISVATPGGATALEGSQRADSPPASPGPPSSSGMASGTIRGWPCLHPWSLLHWPTLSSGVLAHLRMLATSTVLLWLQDAYMK